MTERVSTVDVRQRIGDLLNRVSLRHDEFIIERKGHALAAFEPILSPLIVEEVLASVPLSLRKATSA